MDFDRYDSKFSRDQKKRQDEAKRKRDNEVKLQKEHEARLRNLSELAQKRKEEEEERRIQIELEEAEEARKTGGVKFRHVLTPYSIPTTNETFDDKIILPEECLTELSGQDVFGSNIVIFQLTGSNGVITHGGVREFSAPSGQVGLPAKVLECLGGDLSGLSSVEIKYVLLPKCTYVKLRPKMNRFFEIQPVKRCLEENMLLHTALTVNDTITVWYRGVSHPMIVVEMKPDQAGSLKDTDIEVDLDLSEELQRKNETDRALGANSDQSSASPADGSQQLSPIVNTLGRADNGQPVVRQLSQSILANVDLEPEPESSTDSSIILQAKIRLPNGRTVLRKFLHSSLLLQIFLFLKQELGLDDDNVMKLQLSRRIEPRTWMASDKSSMSPLVDVGLGVRSEAFIASLVP